MTGISPSSVPTGAAGGAADTPDTASAARGETVINTSVIAKIAGLAVRDVSGVHSLGGSAARALGAIREAISSTDHTQGVSVEAAEGQATVDLSIVADYPVPLQQVAEEARTAVIRAIETLAGLHVPAVNVTINDVHLPEEPAETDEAPVQ
jgi:uncharacterized alkaline shock family protein YloU